MTSPSEDLLTFVQNTDRAHGRELDVAITYAASMVRELRVSVAEWEAAVARLRELKSDRAVGLN